MAFVRAQVILRYFTELPEDVATNTMYFGWDGSIGDKASDLVNKLATFYDAFDVYLSEALLTDVEVKLYDMLAPEPRQPYDPPWGFTLDSRVDNGIPEECAVCLSFRGDPPFTARRRGRIYIGPLGESALIVAQPDSFSRVNPSMITAVLAGADVLLDNTDGIDWLIYSPTSNSFVEVTNGWVDNAFDTQRRRGVPATNRNTFP